MAKLRIYPIEANDAVWLKGLFWELLPLFGWFTNKENTAVLHVLGEDIF